jgi:FkbM family methyltransferase
MAVPRAAKVTAHRVLGDRGYTALQTRYWRSRVTRLHYPYEFRPEIEDIVSPGDTVLDIGANVGQYAALLARLVGPKGRVISFEPEPRTFAMLESIVGKIGLSNVETMQLALADFDGTAHIVRVFDEKGLQEIGHTHLASASASEPASVEALVARLDTLCSESLRVETCSFVKIDVEGSESLVLRGAETFLATRRPVLLVELDVAMSARYDTSPDETIAFLNGVGYEQWNPAASDWRRGQSGLFRPV